MSDTTTAKAAARKRAFAARAAAHRAGLDGRAQTHLRSFLAGQHQCDVIAGYMPIRTEIDPIPVMRDLHVAGKSVVVPVIEAAGRPLRFARWSPDAAMIDGPFGAKIPRSEEFLEPDLLIVPLVAFDTNGFRLGYGGGFYDRSLARLRAKKMTLAVGFAYGGQQAEALPVEPTDQPLDALVTENGLSRF